MSGIWLRRGGPAIGVVAAFCVAVAICVGTAVPAAAVAVSSDTEDCLACHEEVTPGIVADWRASRHSRETPAGALGKPEPERRISAASVTEALRNTAVGCAECHTLRADTHADSFDHNGYRVHVVVTPDDCATCHPVEREQYAENLMANAYGNLTGNAVFRDLTRSVNGLQTFDGVAAHVGSSDALTDADSCLSCHGTKVEVQGLAERDTEMGPMEFPVLVGWPNVGVGRVNPDDSKGACTSCHARHHFSIKVARKPYTCAQCHKGPDVPAYPVYMVSKHGNIYDAMEDAWDFEAVPWKVGKDFTAPTCAACHVSLLTAPGGGTIASRTHRMNDRLAHRIFGLIYATPHPKSADTTTIRNQAGLPLPAELTGEPAAEHLIAVAEQDRRRAAMEKVCAACHGRGWYGGHFRKLERTLETTNAMTREATKVLLASWEAGAAQGLPQGGSPFDEAIEKLWVEQWLFYANSIRFASAMGGADYGVFANGRWYLSKNLQDMTDRLRFHLGAAGERTAPTE